MCNRVRVPSRSGEVYLCCNGDPNMLEMPGCGMSTKESWGYGGRQTNREGMCPAGGRAGAMSSGNSMTHSRLGVCNTALALHWSNLASLSPHSPYQNKNVYSVILSIGVTYGLFHFSLFILQELSVKRLHRVSERRRLWTFKQ